MILVALFFFIYKNKRLSSSRIVRVVFWRRTIINVILSFNAAFFLKVINALQIQLLKYWLVRIEKLFIVDFGFRNTKQILVYFLAQNLLGNLREGKQNLVYLFSVKVDVIVNELELVFFELKIDWNLNVLVDKEVSCGLH